MKKSELRIAVQEMDTYQFGLKNELHNKLTKVTSYVPKKEVIDLINQLEEPEQEKVVIPQFVADYIEAMKQQNFTLGQVAEQWSLLTKCDRWVRLNFTKFARAWLDGYTVEKEKLYRVKLLPINRGYLAQWDGTSLQTGYADEHECYENCKTIFTEQEIKAFDERFWTFAEEITK